MTYTKVPEDEKTAHRSAMAGCTRLCFVTRTGRHAHHCDCPNLEERYKPPSARAEPRKPKVSLASIAAAFERNKEGL